VNRRAILVLLLLAGVSTGCQDPRDPDRERDSGRPEGTSTAAARRAPARGGAARPAPAADSEVQTGTRSTPRSAVNAFCSQWANWNWRTIGRQQQRLAALATGGLAQQLEAEARTRAKNRGLRRDRLGTRGRVIAIDVKRTDNNSNAVCVTWEEQLANNRVQLEGARHHVYLTTLQHTGNGWAVTQWEPQP
jgi:hypothetical protein